MSIRVRFLLPLAEGGGEIVADVRQIPAVGEAVQFRDSEAPLRVSRVTHRPHDVRQNAEVLLEVLA